MKVTIDKKVLNEFLEMVSENYLPGDDDIDKFAFEEEPIRAVELMSTQLAVEKPDVSDPEYQPASIPGLVGAAGAIAEEVPPDMIDMFYDGMHRLLDYVYDAHKEKEMQTESRMLIESPGDEVQDLAKALSDFKRRTFNKIKEIEAMGLGSDTVDSYKSELGFIFNEPQDEVQKRQFTLDLIKYAINQDNELRALARNAMRMNRLGFPQLADIVAGLMVEDDIASVEDSEVDIENEQDLLVSQYASNLFEAILNGVPFDTSSAENLTDVQAREVHENVIETISKLAGIPFVDVGGMQVKVSEIIDLLNIELQNYLSASEVDVNMPKPVQDEKETKKTFTALKEFLGFSGAPGARQWYKKHVEDKFLILLRTMLDPQAADPGATEFYNLFSDFYKSTLQKLINTRQVFVNTYALTPGSVEEKAMENLLADLSEAEQLLMTQDNILDIQGDRSEVIKIMTSHLGDALALSNEKLQNILTNFIKDYAAKDIAVRVVTSNYPNISKEDAVRLHENISGKSNRPFTDSEKTKNKFKTASKKFLALGIDEAGYLKIVKDYLEELDEVLQLVLLSPAKAKTLYGSKYDVIQQKYPDMSSLFNKMEFKSDLKEADIIGIMDEALAQYLADINQGNVGNIQESKMLKLKKLAEIIGICL